jgi:hypothetical protein
MKLPHLTLGSIRSLEGKFPSPRQDGTAPSGCRCRAGGEGLEASVAPRSTIESCRTICHDGVCKTCCPGEPCYAVNE